MQAAARAAIDVGKPVELVPDAPIVVPPDEQMLQLWFSTARTWVENETATSLASVRLKLLSREQMTAIADATLYQLFIDKPVSFDLLKKLKQRNGRATRPSVVALFDPVLNDILLPREGLLPFSRTVAKKGTSLQDAYSALFVHELTHAADYLKYPDNIIFSQENLGNLAVRAVVEGHAQYLTKILCEKHGCQRGYATLRDDVVSALDPAAANSHLSAHPGEALSNFCYFHGERFFSSIESQPGAIEQVLASPPTDPVMIRYPDVYLDGTRERKQILLTDAFRSVAVPWNPERSLLLHNSSFVPFEGYNTRRQLAQNNYEVLHESSAGVDTTNITIFWKSSTSVASSFYQRLLKPSKKRLSGDGNYEVRLLKKSSDQIPLQGDNIGDVTSARLGALQFGYKPTKNGLQNNMPDRVQQIYVATAGPFVVSVARLGSSASSSGLRSYTAGLLQALQP